MGRLNTGNAKALFSSEPVFPSLNHNCPYAMRKIKAQTGESENRALQRILRAKSKKLTEIRSKLHEEHAASMRYEKSVISSEYLKGETI